MPARDGVIKSNLVGWQSPGPEWKSSRDTLTPAGSSILTPAGSSILTPAGGKGVRVIAADKILADFARILSLLKGANSSNERCFSRFEFSRVRFSRFLDAVLADSS